MVHRHLPRQCRRRPDLKKPKKNPRELESLNFNIFLLWNETLGELFPKSVHQLEVPKFLARSAQTTI